MKRQQIVLAVLSIVLLGLALRLPGLSGYLTPDEVLWSGRTAAFGAALLNGDRAATTTSSHPGITTTWAGASGVTLGWLLARPPETSTLADLFAALRADPTRLDMLPWLRLPIILLSALGVALIFLLARGLYGDAVGLLAAGFLLFNPFLLAHTKILHLDGLLTLSLSIAWLAFLVAGRTGRRRYDLICGLAVGFALVTKSPALVLLPLLAAGLLLRRLPHAPSTRAAMRAVVSDALWLGISALAVALVLWPALWVDPVANIRRVLGLMAAYGQTGHELGNFWLGRPVESPGVLFYPAITLWRTTPVTLIGLLLAAVLSVLALAGPRAGRAPGREGNSGPPWALWAFVLWFGVILSLGDKKFDRYLLPIFPMLDLLAAWGWATAARQLVGARQPARAQAGLWLAATLLVIAQAGIALANRPSYLTAYNPLLGGTRTAEKALLIGWGEGLEETAAYLNEMGDGGRVASWYGHNVFGPFYRGESFDLYYDLPGASDLYRNDISYVVTYVNQLQRDKLSPDIAERLGPPIYTVQHGNTALAQVYTWPRPFDHTTEREVAPGLRLLGWDFGPHDPATGALPLTLYWDQEALAAADPPSGPVTAWIKDAAGEVWAVTQGEIAPGAVQNGWLDRPAIAQSLALDAPVGLLPGSYRIEVAPPGGESFGLAEEPIGPAQAAAATPDWIAIPEEVVFDGGVNLRGYTIERRPEGVILDLLWEASGPPAGPLKFFVHAVDDAGQIVAQHDGCLGAPTCATDWAWGTGQLFRQRAHLPSDVTSQDGPTFFVGLYDPATGTRLPLTVDGQPVPDARYGLYTFNAPP